MIFINENQRKSKCDKRKKRNPYRSISGKGVTTKKLN